MIDVLMVLLIIFMAITPTMPSGLEAVVPQESAEAAGKLEAPVVLEIAADGSYRLNSEGLAVALLEDRLTEVFRRRGDRVLFLKAAETLDYSVVAAAIDSARGVNIDRIALMPR